MEAIETRSEKHEVGVQKRRWLGHWPESESCSDQWFVLRTKSRQEKALAEALTARGIAFFLPLFRAVRYYGRRKVQSELPLFACYLFVHGQLEDAYMAERTGRVAQVLQVSDQRGLGDDLHNLRRALEFGATLSPHPWIRDGVQAEVSAGPFRGVRGKVCGLQRRDRLILLIDAIGGAAELEIDQSLLAPLC